jgi:hypothetical protein
MFAQDAYSSWGTTWLLIGGDTDHIPIRYVWTEYYTQEFIPTDMYYSHLDGNWNADGDHIFGEAYGGAEDPGDYADLYPDMYVGRAPVNNLYEAETFVDKILNYTKTPPTGFGENLLFLAEVLFPYDWIPGEPVIMDGADICEAALDSVPGSVSRTKLYENYTEFPGSIPLSVSAGTAYMNVGYNLVAQVGHGFESGMRLGNGVFGSTDADALTNGSRASFFFLLNCSAAAVDKDNISEHLLNNPDGGAFGVIGASRLAFPSTASYYQDLLFDYLYSDGVTDMGRTLAETKAYYAPSANTDNAHRWTQMSYILMGDPEARIWTDGPDPLIVDYPSTVVIGDTLVTVDVQEDGSPVDSAMVCLSKDDEVYARAFTNSSGIAQLSFAADTPGSLHVTVTALNALTHIGAIQVSGSALPHIYSSSWALDDSSGVPLSGNGNGFAEAGETVALIPSVSNGGTSGATGVYAIASTADTLIQIAADSIVVGSVGSGSTEVPDSGFVISVDMDAPNEHDATITITYVDDVMNQWQEDTIIRLLAPDMILVQNVYDDSLGGNDNGVPENGETIIYYPVILNDGNGTADSVTATLVSLSGSYSVSDNSGTLGSIDGGEVKQFEEGFSFDVNSPPAGELSLILSDSRGHVWEIDFDAEPPQSPTDITGSSSTNSILLTWTPVLDQDLDGYLVYSSDTNDGPYQAIDDVPTDNIAQYDDDGLVSFTRYYYVVCSRDSSGNVSLPSEQGSWSTTAPQLSGWPQQMGSGSYATPVIYDLDHDGSLEVIAASDEIYAWNHDGTEMTDGDNDIRTVGMFIEDGSYYRASPVICDMDLDGIEEIICASWDDEKLYVWNYDPVQDTATAKPGWPKSTGGFVYGTPAVGDIDGDGYQEVVALTGGAYALMAWNHDGTEVADGDNNPSTDGILYKLTTKWNYCSPAIGNLDGTGAMEVVFGTYTGDLHVIDGSGNDLWGWPYSTGETIVSSPALVDFDEDGDLEIVFSSNDDTVRVMHHDKVMASGWPQRHVQSGELSPSPAVGDMDNDGDLDIVLGGSNGRVVLKTYEGDLMVGWPVYIDGDIMSSPVVGDIDGDDLLDVVIGSDEGSVYAWDRRGNLIDGWPGGTSSFVFSTPTICDLDDDGDVEVVVAGMDTRVYAWDVLGSYDEDLVPWPTFRHDTWRTGCLHFSGIPIGIEDEAEEYVSAGTLSRTRLLPSSPNPFNPSTQFTFELPKDGRVKVGVYDVTGGLVRRIYEGGAQKGTHTFAWNGRDQGGRPVAAGVYFVKLDAEDGAYSQKITLVK